MGTLTASAIIDRAAKTLLDAGFVRWTQAELLTHYNAAIRTILGFKPDAYVVVEAVALVAGPKQTIPAAGVSPRAVRRNMGVTGTTAGEAITQVERDDLDHCRTDWGATPGSAVKHVVFDPSDPRTFYVYPQVYPWYVELAYAALPADSTTATALPIDDLYEAPIHSYVVGLAMQKSSKSGDLVKSDWHARQFASFLGLKSEGQFRFSVASPQQEQAKQKA